jgi:DNA (cytosine-5)-methyltransferase 1
MKFIDLFAGLGGFHVALTRLGHECVFASEIKTGLASLYERNFDLKPHSDIRKVKSKDIPAHDILCAGFPCQPFSKAGMQRGLADETNGDLFHQIIRILRYHTPSYFILENVQHLAKHDNQDTYSYISTILRNIGYNVKGHILSPHNYGIPQHRQRLFIVGSKTSLKHFEWPEEVPLSKDAYSFLDERPANAISLEKEKEYCLEVWQDFLNVIPQEDKLPSFPIWAMEFGATYPFENQTPFASSNYHLGKTRGNFGIPLGGMSREQKFKNLPSYARTEEEAFPKWKKSYIRSNRAFYEKYEKQLRPIVNRLKELGTPSWQKFEWNVQGGDRNVRDYIIQFRGSGIRLKRPDFFPSLVCVSTQIPIVGWEMRYITKWEGARLQGLEKLTSLPEKVGSSFDALGNAVNAEVVYLIASKLFQKAKANKKDNKLVRHIHQPHESE